MASTYPQPKRQAPSYFSNSRRRSSSSREADASRRISFHTALLEISPHHTTRHTIQGDAARLLHLWLSRRGSHSYQDAPSC
ncbi:hypothetical protein HYQ46_000700 [Verticillium longisporum]|nr:hypothetical protein HYQ46_000700 [Verticillium longisporum]